MKQIGVAVIGTGWCGGIRAETLAKHPLVKGLHLAESRRERLDELSKKLKPASATADYKQLLGNREIEAVYISATPESTHYPMARDALAAGKHVFLEKPIAMTLPEADELIATAKSKGLKFTIGYSQQNYGAMRAMSGGDVPDQQWLMVTMDNGVSVVVGGGWSLPLGYPNFSTTWIEMIGTDGAVLVDDSHKDVVVNTVQKGMQL